ncbi:MAG: prepilin-type N-terminal cleavage/methylation domain-containing protein [Terriglobia bacterium]|jgi:prepilin-type N-terminal cleavage/methylation domain-containing protein
MSQSPTREQPALQGGFTLIAILVASAIRAVGLMATALRGENVNKPTVRDRGVAGRRSRVLRAEGFSLIEMLVTISIIGILSGMAYLAFINVMPTVRADSALQLLAVQLRQAREASVDQRRIIQVTFKGTSEIVTVRQNLDLTTTQLSDYFLPYQMAYSVLSGVGDTPDHFGNSSAVSLNCTGMPCTITFQSDGAVFDSSGNFVNGTVFIGISGRKQTARAVTILGATGRIKGYRYSGTSWF